MDGFDALLVVLLVVGVLAVVGSLALVRRVPREIRAAAVVPLVVVLAGFAIGFLALTGVLG